MKSRIVLMMTLMSLLALSPAATAFSQSTGANSTAPRDQQGTSPQSGAQASRGTRTGQLDPGVHEAPSGSGVNNGVILQNEPNFTPAPEQTTAPGTSEQPQTVQRGSWGLLVVIGLFVVIVVYLAWRSTRPGDTRRDRAA
jgi:hypothetical protein